MENPNGSTLSLLDEGFGGMTQVGLWPVFKILNQISSSLNRILVHPCLTLVLSDTVPKPIH